MEYHLDCRIRSYTDGVEASSISNYTVPVTRAYKLRVVAYGLDTYAPRVLRAHTHVRILRRRGTHARDLETESAWRTSRGAEQPIAAARRENKSTTKPTARLRTPYAVRVRATAPSVPK